MIDPERVSVRAGAVGDRHRFGEDRGDTTLRAQRVVLHITLGREAVARAVVCPHRGHDKTVLQHVAADPPRVGDACGRAAGA